MPSTQMKGSPELTEAGRQLAQLALEKLQQDGSLGVRQREQLRRALATAADALDWDAIPGNRNARAAAATRHVAALAEAGAHSLEQDIADLLDDKKAEIAELEKVTRAVHALATDANASFPAEVEYSHTARDGTRTLVTRTETLVLADADEAVSAAATLEKRLDGFTKLRDQMLEDLEQRQHQVGEMRHALPGFVAWSNTVVLDVLATLT